jgi:hypothetical protein
MPDIWASKSLVPNKQLFGTFRFPSVHLHTGTSVSDPEPYHFGKPDQDPHQIKSRIWILIKVINFGV